MEENKDILRDGFYVNMRPEVQGEPMKAGQSVSTVDYERTRLIYALSGSAVLRFEDRHEELLAGGFMAVIPNYQKVELTKRDDGDVLAVSFATNTLLYILDDKSGTARPAQPSYKGSYFTDDHILRLSFGARKVFEAVEAYRGTGILSPTLLSAKLLELFLLIGQEMPEEDKRLLRKMLGGTSSPFVSDVLRLAEPGSTVTGLAREMGMGRDVFIETFKKHFGTVPSAWLNKRRCDYITAYVRRHPGTSLTQLAGIMGFGSVINMRRFTKRWMNCTPKELYR